MKWTNFSVASVVAAGSVAALVVACSSTTVNGTTDAGPAKTDSGPANTTDSGPTATDGGSSTGACPAASVPASDVPTWVAPKAVQPGACNATELTAIQSNFNSSTAQFTDLYPMLGATCQACVFSNQTDTNWQVVVWAPDMATGMGNAFFNYGACYSLAPGGSAACGKGEQDDQFCFQSACPSPACDGSDMGQTCVDTAAMGVCMTYDNEITTGCGSATTSLDNICGDAFSAVSFMCGSGASDGGTDGG